MSCEHRPRRPSWDCEACDRPWPCDPAREYLASTLDDYLVPVYMVGQLELAAADLLPAVSADELYERFVAWTRPAPLPLPEVPPERAIGRAQVPRGGRHRED